MPLREDIESLLRSLCPMFYLGSFSSKAALQKCREAASAGGMETFYYSISGGLRRPGEEKSAESLQDPLEVLHKIASIKFSGLGKRRLFVLEHFDLLIGNGDPVILTRLRDINDRANRGLSIVLTGTPYFGLPEILSDLPRLDAPFPEEPEIEAMVLACQSDLEKDALEGIIGAVKGLTELECENLLSLCLARKGELDRDFLDQQRSALLCRRARGMVELVRPTARWDQLGGLELLKSWLARRGRFLKAAPDARCGIPSPRGVLVTGPPGCGKSLLAHAVAEAWKVNLVKFHPARNFSSLVGETEKNLQTALQTALSLAPCVFWVDEFEKFFPRSEGRSSDGGVLSRVLGLFLDFLHSEREGVFVCATANSMEALPEEITRAGRFDAVFFMDLPNRQERKDIFEIVFGKYGVDLKLNRKSAILAATEGFSGAEIAQAVLEALYERADSGGRLDELTLMRHVRAVTPLSGMLGERLEDMRAWSRTWARPASVQEETTL